MIVRITLSLVLVGCFAFTSNKTKPFVPPGTVQITDTFFADETEISNLSWQEYELWTKQTYGYHSPEHLATLPDTLVWRDKSAYNEPYVQYYYRHPAYKNYPVVGVSYEQAVAFCQWRTGRVKEFYALRYKKMLEITYRLPSKEEWELLSTNGSAVLSNEGKDVRGRMQLNCARLQDTSAYAGQTDVTAPVYSYLSNRFGLFNTFGNVSEMTDEKGTSKGGSWRHQPESCRAGKTISYSKAEAWLGFRCVCITNKAG